MSIALERNNTRDHRIERSGFSHKMACAFPVYNSLEYDAVAGDRLRKEDRGGSSSESSTTSSIGRNSDESSSGGGLGKGGDGEEVQSEYKGGPLDSLEALEEVLPMKRGISKFYSGKSKSFTSLADATSSSSIKDIVKPENACTRKRKTLLAHNLFNKSHDNIPRSNCGGFSKRPTSSRSLLALSAAKGQYESSSNSDGSNSNSSSPVLSLPPLPPHSRRTSNNESSASPEGQKFSWRSFSLSDLQGAAAAAASSGITGLLGDNDAKLGKLR